MEKIRTFYPNQNQVHINKIKVEKNSGNPYACIYRYSMEEAQRNLKPNTFKVWLWFVSNTPNYTIQFSPQYISTNLKMSTNTAKSSWKELLEKGYLIESDKRGHLYEFYEEPQKKISLYQEKREFLDTETGEYIYLTYSDLLQNVENEAQAKQLWEDAE